VAKSAEGGKIDAAKAKAIHKKYEELNHVMYIFKPRPKGLGVGPKGKADGIELKIITLGKRPLSEDAFKAQRGELLRMAYIVRAVAEVTQHYAPAKPKGGKGAKEWKQFTDEMQKASGELIEAIKKGDPAAVKTAASNVTSSCNNCHSDFRDAN
jgi:cytochrome c556